MNKSNLKRLLRYIVVTALISYMLLIVGIREAFFERGYFAVGGEIFIPFLVAIAAATIYNRNEIVSTFKTDDEMGEQ